MNRIPDKELRRGWTTGACATAATKAALLWLWQGTETTRVSITLPKGETPDFALAHRRRGDGWAECGIVKDAGDDPDATHGALIVVRVSASPGGVVFKAGDGVGTVTRPGLPIAVGEPAINPAPRAMMQAVVAEIATQQGMAADVTITVSIPGGARIAEKTWNGRLGIKGGLSILGTTGIVRPFSCAAWIASIHRGIDVARAEGAPHVAGCTGNTSEKAVQAHFDLPDFAMLDMGDFAGGMLKYLRRHPVARVTIAGGIGKMSKLAQGAMDLHSKRSTVDFAQLNSLARAADLPDVADANTALEAYGRAGPKLAELVANKARLVVADFLGDAGIDVDTMIVDRAGIIVARGIDA